jgi:DNA-binding response OmpR family regulator
MIRPLILIADDDRDIRDLLRILLLKENYDVLEASDGREALSLLAANRDRVSLIILDIMMPRMDGLGAASEIRKLTDAPILFLTARSSDADKTAAYAGGGDDYVTKPFHATDLLLKLRAMLRRYTLYRSSVEAAEPAREEKNGYLFSGDVEWRPEEEAVYRMGERVVLTEREYQLFARLCRGRGENLSAATLYEDVWNEPYLASSSNTVIVHIANLRRKLEKDPSSPAIIRTVWGKGYRID